MHQALILKYLRGLKQQMSASREKQNRQAQAGQTNPKTAREAQQRREQKRSSILYGLIALAFVAVDSMKICLPGLADRHHSQNEHSRRHRRGKL